MLVVGMSKTLSCSNIKNKMKNKKVNLFIVGEPKSGTTALANFLGQHPDIYVPEIKEPHFFCTDFHEKSDKFHGHAFWPVIRKLEKYVKLFEGQENRNILCDASTSYIYSSIAAKNIHDYNPEAKIVVLFREPVEFLYSCHSQLVFSGSENLNFRDAMNNEKIRKKGEHIPKRISVPLNVFYSDRIKYSEQLTRYLDVFPRSQILTIIYEDFREDNLKVFQKVLKFLGMNDNFIPEFKEINTNKKIKSKLMASLEYRHGFKKIVGKLLPRAIKAGLLKFYKSIAFKNEPREKLDKAFKKRLMLRFKPEVIKLGRLLNIDLSSRWGYDNI